MSKLIAEIRSLWLHKKFPMKLYWRDMNYGAARREDYYLIPNKNCKQEDIYHGSIDSKYPSVYCYDQLIKMVKLQTLVVRK